LSLIELDEGSLQTIAAEPVQPELAVWRGRIGLLAALIGESDLYIGYDSVGQHIASAMGAPCIDVFGGFSSRRMLDRWRPTGKSETRVVVVEPGAREKEVLAETVRHAGELLKRFYS
jgi:ADP-heptose:LPS heptosyltransferase